MFILFGTYGIFFFIWCILNAKKDDHVIVERVFTLCPELFSLFIVEAFSEGSTYIRELIQDINLFETKDKSDSEGIFIVKVEEQIVGLICLFRNKKQPNHQHSACLKHLYILPQARYQGYGTHLINVVLAYATKYYVSVSFQSRSPYSNNFLKKFDFEKVNDDTYTLQLVQLNH